MFRLAVFISGRGSLLPPLIKALDAGVIPAKISCVISDRPGSAGLERAGKAGLPVMMFDRKEYTPRKSLPDGPVLSDVLLEYVRDKADYIVLAGFLSILEGAILEEYEGRILNIHPALLPKHGGRGMYGLRVHQSVIESGDDCSGSTVHFVTSGVDTGPIIVQRKVIVSEDETAETLQKKVHEIEGDTLVEALRIILEPKCAGLRR